MNHHTKLKGDLGVLKARCDLTQRGYLTLTPDTEHSPFDLVIYLDGEFKRVQVKYREAKEGKLCVAFKSCWSDKHGVHTVPVDKSVIDLYCVYCPQTDKCYYFNPSNYGKSLTLRIDPPKNNQVAGVKLASDFNWVP